MRSKTILVDVDDTLVRSFGSKRIPMSGMVTRIRELHEAGATLYLWSSGGAEYCRETAQELGISECFVAFLPKPELLIDDVSPSEWKQLRWFHPNEATSATVEELLQ